MSDLIDRNHFHKRFLEEWKWCEEQGFDTQPLRYVDNLIDTEPSAQPERKKGKWIKTGQSFVFPEKFRNYSCSECGYDVDKTKFNFCPNCGAMMEVQDEIV